MNAGRAVALMMSIDGSTVRHSGVTPRLRSRRRPDTVAEAAAEPLTGAVTVRRSRWWVQRRRVAEQGSAG